MNSLRKLMASVQSAFLWRYNAFCFFLSSVFAAKLASNSAKADFNEGKLAKAACKLAWHFAKALDEAL